MAGSRAVPSLAQRAASEGPRWTRAVWPSPATCPKDTPTLERETVEKNDGLECAGIMRAGRDSLPPPLKVTPATRREEQMLILKKRFALVLAVLSLEACTPWRAIYLEESVGKVSQDDVTKQLGPPHLERSLADGSMVWTYQHRSAVVEGTGGKCTQYGLVFDKSMILHN